MQMISPPCYPDHELVENAIPLFDVNEIVEAAAHADRTNQVVYTWVTGEGDALIKGFKYVNRYGYVVMPHGLPDEIVLEDQEESNV